MNKPPQLLIPLDEIPAPGLVIEGDLAEDWLQESLLTPYTATAPLGVSVELRRMGENVLVQGKLQIGLSFVCSRSGELGTTDLSVPMSELFQPAGSHSLNLGEAELSSEDLGADEPFVYEGRQINLEPLIRESIVLAQDPFPTRSDTAAPDSDAAAWSSRGDEIDPRWAKLKELELS